MEKVWIKAHSLSPARERRSSHVRVAKKDRSPNSPSPVATEGEASPTFQYLSDDNLEQEVKLPPGMDVNEWLAVNGVFIPS